MKRRDVLTRLLLIPVPGLFAGCGGGNPGSSSAPATSEPEITHFSSDKSTYYIGEPATFTASFTKGKAILLPFGVEIQSNVPVTVPYLTTSRITLQIQGDSPINRVLSVQLKYREQWQRISMGAMRSCHVTAQSGGTLYVVGGSDLSGSFPTAVLQFDAFSERFYLGGNLLAGRNDHSATMLKNGSAILVVGGSRSGTDAPRAECYDCVTGRSRATAGQPADNRSFHSATLLDDGKILLVGGQTLPPYDAAGHPLSSSADIYDPVTERFTRLASRLQYGRQQHHAKLLRNGTVLIYGGWHTSSELVVPFELYDPLSQTFSTLPASLDMAPARIEDVIVSLEQGDNMLLVGGSKLENGEPDRGIWRYAMTGSKMDKVGNLTEPRAAQAGVQLLDERVLVTGGYRDLGLQPLASVDLYLPATAATVAGPAMSSVRMNHTADLLVNGKVIVIGGDTGGIGISDSAELFS